MTIYMDVSIEIKNNFSYLCLFFNISDYESNIEIGTSKKRTRGPTQCLPIHGRSRSSRSYLGHYG